MKNFDENRMNIRLFDGGAAAGGSSAGSAAGGSQAGPDSTQQGKTGGETVVYGKQTTGGDNAAQPSGQTTTGHDAGGQEDRSAKFKELINGEFKDLYTEEVNRIIGKRFKETKSLQEQLDGQSPILNTLAAKYGTKPGDMEALQEAIDNDNAMWEQAAEDAGMTVEQYRQVQKLQRENQQLKDARDNAWRIQQHKQQVQTWLDQAAAMKTDPMFRDFDLSKEIDSNPQFMELIKRGVTVDMAYKVTHMEDYLSAATAQAEKAVTSNIRARGARPAENGASAKPGGSVVKDDPKKWTDDDMREVFKRVARGERIIL